MKKIEYRCPKCGSTEVLQDAYLHLNSGETSTYDQLSCGECGYEFDTADEVELDEPVEEILEFYAVSGRVCGDDEDTTLVFKASGRGDAISQFREQMWELEGLTPEEIDQAEACGEGVFVNSTVKSRTAIVEV